MKRSGMESPWHPISLSHTALQVCIFSLTGDGNRASVRSDVAGRPIFADLRHFGPLLRSGLAQAGFTFAPKRKALCSKLSSPSACTSVPSFFWSRVQSFIVSTVRNDLLRADIPCPTHHRGSGLCLVPSVR